MKIKLDKTKQFFGNPVMVKELRQTVKGNITVIGMNVFLFILLIIILIVFIDYKKNEAVVSSSYGKDIFGFMLSVLAIICCGILPLVLYQRTSTERNPDDRDLMYITTMSSSKVVLGKYFTAITLLMFYISTCLPFLIIPYLFKGISVAVMLRAIVQVTAVSILFVQLAIFLGSFPKRRALHYLLILAMIGLTILFIVFMVEVMFPSVYRSYGRVDPLWHWLTIPCYAAWFLLLFILNHAMLLPDTANRAILPRIYITILLIISYFCALYAAYSYREAEMFFVWLVFGWAFCLAPLVFSIAERDHLSIRIRSRIPKGIKAPFVYLFFSGSFAGILWSSILMYGSIVIAYFTFKSLAASGLNVRNFYAEAIEQLTAANLAITFWALLIYYITRSIKSYDLRPHAWFLAIVWIGSLAVGIPILYEIFNLWHDDTLLAYFSPFGAMMEGDDAVTQNMLEIYVILTIAAVVLNLRYFIPQIVQFKRAPRQTLTIEEIPEQVPTQEVPAT